MSGDVLTMAQFEQAKRMLLDNQSPIDGPLRYFANRAELSSARWLAWFKANYPDVELVEVRPIPRG